MTDAADWALRLAQRVAAVRDPELRVSYLRHELARMDPGALVDIVAIAASMAEARTPPSPELLLALSLALDDASFGEARRAAAVIAAERGQHGVVALLGRPPEGEAEALPVPDFGSGRPLTLGERKSLARKSDRDLLARVLRDPHPDVIRILLGNPTLTEPDVVRLCARRPVAPDVLREVFHSTRWIVRYGVRRAIVLNPHTPLDVAMQLVFHLTAQDRRFVASSGELREELRRACEAIPERRTVH